MRSKITKWFTNQLKLSFISLGVPKNYSIAFAKSINELMNNKSLYYHNTTHIFSIIEFARKYKIKLDKKERHIILMHDAFFVVNSKLNEDNSAKLNQMFLENFCDAETVSFINQGIMQTKQHLNSETSNYDLILDLDLHSLSFDYYVFQKINKSICKENEGNSTNSKEFLKCLINKPYIYKTKLFLPFEEIARNNINKYLS
jgi:predicted metal-dependent HD superfamily phosphohydrolase